MTANPFETIDARLSNIEVLLLELRNSKQVPPPPPPERIKLIGDQAAADYLNVSVLTVRLRKRKKEIPYYRHGRRYYYYSDELDRAFQVPRRNGKKV